MPYCPKCHYEYTGDIDTCPDCDVKLVAEMPQEFDETDYKDWVRIARFRSEQYAKMVIEALHSKDIPAVIFSGAGYFGATGQMGLSSFSPIDGAYSLMVPTEYVDVACFEGEALLGEEWEKSRVDD